MSWLMKALCSSVGQKFLMGITGLLLCGFLVVHLGGNFFLFVGQDAYNDYAHKLHSQEGLLKVAEAGLFGLFLLHILLAIVTGRQNRKARGRTDYLLTESKQGPSPIPSGGARSWMFATGAVVLGFLILHLVDFTWEARGDLEYVGKDPFMKARMILTNPVSAVFYSIGCIVLGVHLSHGFASAFQSLGINHPKYNGMLRCLSLTFAWFIAIGFVSFVYWAWQYNS